MAETQPSKSDSKRERQPVSIPFIWEVKPGTPKKDWKPETNRPTKAVAPPVKLVVSVPFSWEEKPGTPLPSFAQHMADSTVTLLPPQQHSIASPSQPPLQNLDHSYRNWSSTGYGGKDGTENGGGSSESEPDTCSFETYDSFSSARSLLANGLVPNAAVSSAIAVQRTSLSLTGIDNNDYLESPGSPGSDTQSVSSYATGTTSLVGTSFLEWLFPLLASHASLPSKAGCLETDPSVDGQGHDFLVT